MIIVFIHPWDIFCWNVFKASVRSLRQCSLASKDLRILFSANTAWICSASSSPNGQPVLILRGREIVVNAPQWFKTTSCVIRTRRTKTDQDKTCTRRLIGKDKTIWTAEDFFLLLFIISFQVPGARCMDSGGVQGRKFGFRRWEQEQYSHRKRKSKWEKAK